MRSVECGAMPCWSLLSYLAEVQVCKICYALRQDFKYYPKTTSTDFVTHMVNENYMQTAQLRQETS